jgi:putative ABC transport system permease protein
VRLGARMLRKNLGFTCAAVTVLALGIGANSAIFSLVNAFLFKPLMMQSPSALVGVYSRDTPILPLHSHCGDEECRLDLEVEAG